FPSGRSRASQLRAQLAELARRDAVRKLGVSPAGEPVEQRPLCQPALDPGGAQVDGCRTFAGRRPDRSGTGQPGPFGVAVGRGFVYLRREPSPLAGWRTGGGPALAPLVAKDLRRRTQSAKVADWGAPWRTTSVHTPAPNGPDGATCPPG